MSETKTYCVGRYLVDLPKDAEIHGQSYDFMFGRINSEKTEIDAKGFAARMKNREAELKAGKQKSKFNLTETLNPSADIRIFKLSRTYDFRPTAPPSVGLEIYRLDNGTIFSMEATGFNNEFPQIVERLKSQVLPGIRSRQADEIPSDPGFCIKNGFIADDGSQRQYEDAGMSFKFARWPDLVITVSTRIVSKSGEETLLQRINSHPIPAIFAAVVGQIRTLRKGVHDVHGRKGEEILALLPTDAGIKQHSFRWEAAGTVGTPLAPDLTVEYESGTRLNGKPRQPTLTDDQAIQLFDSIVNSIRLRPTGPAEVSSAEPSPLLPLGEAIATGAVCPQNGWWQCNEHINDPRIKIEGGRQQFFQVGQVMPQAVLLGTPTFWQKLFEGKKPFRQPTTTVWKLDAYDDATAQSLLAAKTTMDKTSEV